jgi:hypothetical protein
MRAAAIIAVALLVAGRLLISAAALAGLALLLVGSLLLVCWTIGHTATRIGKFLLTGWQRVCILWALETHQCE